MVKLGNEWLVEKCALLQGNPKRGKSADRYEQYKRARTLQEVLDLGGSKADIANDVVRGFIMLEDRGKHKQLVAILNDKSGSMVEARSPKPSPSSPPEALSPRTSKASEQIASPEQPALPKPSPEPPNPRKRLIASTKSRVNKFGRTVGRGRLLPYYSELDT